MPEDGGKANGMIGQIREVGSGLVEGCSVAAELATRYLFHSVLLHLTQHDKLHSSVSCNA